MRRALIFPLLLTGACSLVPDYLRPELDFANQWEELPPAVASPAQTLPARWWEAYQSPTLNALVTQALAQNNDLAAAVARVDQARAQVRIARAELFPQVNVTASNTRDITRTVGERDVSSQAGAALSYELDLFGRIRANRDAAKFTSRAVQFDRDALSLIVAGDVTAAYLSLLTGIERQRLAEANLKASRDVLNIIEAQFREGRSSGLEVAQQRTVVANTQATIATLIRGQEIDRHQLATLTGNAAQNFKPALDEFKRIAVPKIAPTLPATLLEQRPDIRAAEAQLQAANANIGVARAAFFPRTSIGLNAGWVEGGGSTVSFAGDMLAPIFQGGALSGQLEVSEARKQELAANYRSTVLTAFQESSDALSAVKSAEERIAALTIAAQQSQEANTIARARYVNGASDYQAVLDTQRTLLSTQDSAATAQYDQWEAAILLYKALGGTPRATAMVTPTASNP